MNILISSAVHWWNAEAAYAAVLAEVLRDAGHRVFVLTRPGTRNHAELEKRGLPLLTDVPLWERSPAGLWRAVRRLSAFQQAEGIQVVNVFRSRELPWHLLAARGAGAPRIVRTRGSAMPVRGHWVNRRLYGACHALIASSEVVRGQMLSALRLPPERIHTLYYPIDLPPLPPPEQQRTARAAFLADQGLAPETLVLAVVGRIYPEKGHEPLLEALARLKERFPALALLILDKQADDPLPWRKHLEDRAHALGLDGNLRWLGFQEDVRALMALADLGVVPSLASEVNCRVTVEFFSAGTPVVAFPTGALPEVIEDGRTGRVTGGHDPGTLAVALGGLLADKPAREAMAHEARRAAETRFSRQRFLEGTLAVFESALTGRR